MLSNFILFVRANMVHILVMHFISFTDGVKTKPIYAYYSMSHFSWIDMIEKKIIYQFKSSSWPGQVHDVRQFDVRERKKEIWKERIIRRNGEKNEKLLELTDYRTARGWRSKSICECVCVNCDIWRAQNTINTHAILGFRLAIVS